MSIPTDIDELKRRMKLLGVSDEDLDKFQEEVDDADHDIASITEDISDREQSMLVDFFREECAGGEKIYDVVKAIMDGTEIENKITTQQQQKQPHIDSKIDDVDSNNQTAKPIKKAIEKPVQESKNDEEEKLYAAKWTFNKREEKEGTVILNAGLICIPDEVITNSYYLENIEGITYVLYYNNCGLGLCGGECRLPFCYIEFWNEYLKEGKDVASFAQIADDILHNEGPTYDYLMEHPPNDRILPVLEKVVDQLKYPQLDSEKLKRRKEIYKKDIEVFFEQQLSEYNYGKNTSLIQTCILFKSNTNDTNFNTFELFINIMDIYDRIIFANANKIKPRDITGANHDIIRKEKHHFAAKLSRNDYVSLNETLVHFKDRTKNSFFPTLSVPNSKKNLISDNLSHFQRISLSFFLFIKSFMCETGNCLEKGYHIYKAKKSKKKRKGSKAPVPFTANIASLSQIKNKKVEEISDADIFFHNENMPLQCDLCIIAKGDKQSNALVAGLETEYKEFEIKSARFQTPTDRQSVYALYGLLVTVFREVISAQKNKNAADPDNQRRDNRYCIVFDRNVDRFYMYPPHIKNGNGKITNRKRIITNKKQEKNGKKDKKNKKETGNGDGDGDGIDLVENKFSLISHEYNDLTNFYLTNKCMIPTAEKTHVGIHDLQFVLSVHLHKQRQWHRHPKLRIYQYFNGGEALRFFYSNKMSTDKRYGYDKDIIELWPQFFVGENGITEQFIQDCHIFDAVFDLYKCDAQYFQWDNAVKRQLKK